MSALNYFIRKERRHDLQLLDQRSTALVGFDDASPPLLSPTDHLVTRTEQILINRPFQVVAIAMDTPPNEVIRPSGNLPGVSGTRVLTGDEFGGPGSRRVVFLTDDSTLEEQALEREQKDTEFRFRYLVWNYSSPKGRPVEYAIGEFRTSQVDASHTRLIWIYSFKLRNSMFPGRLGGFGRWLFRVTFVDRDYAALMRSALQRYKENAEKLPEDISVSAQCRRNPSLTDGGGGLRTSEGDRSNSDADWIDFLVQSNSADDMKGPCR
jgi:hypothetical protein